MVISHVRANREKGKERKGNCDVICLSEEKKGREERGNSDCNF